MPLFYLSLSTLFLLVGLGVTYWMHHQVQIQLAVPPTEQPVQERPKPCISVIVPARNEARNIQRCVQALLDQDYPDYELIVVDDRSTDQTPEILASFLERPAARGRLRVIQGSDPPPGWAGKPHALSLGVAQAQGEWLCFVDADTFAQPNLLSATYAAAYQYQAEMFSILTQQELGSFWEKIILPLVFTALAVGFPAERVNDPDQPDAIANGQFILIRRAVYAAVGGHAAVYDQIAEDKALADLVKHSGYRLIVADGRSVASTRMYTNLAEIWEGWTKNIFLGMRDQLGLLFFGIMVGLLAALFLPVWLLGGLAWFITSPSWVSGLVGLPAIIVWGYLLWKRVQASRAFHISPWYALTLPLGALLFSAMMIASAYKVISGHGVTWKGRRYT